MAIRKEEEKKNGMKIIDNMDGEKSAEDKLNMAKVSYGKELDKLPGNTLQEKLEKKLGIKVIRNIRLQDAIKLLKKNK
jgi:hypothetical protein